MGCGKDLAEGERVLVMNRSDHSGLELLSTRDMNRYGLG